MRGNDRGLRGATLPVTSTNLFQSFVDRVRDHRPVALATVIEGPAWLGAKALIDRNGLVGDTLKDVPFRRTLLERARELFERGRSETFHVEDHRVFVEVRHPAPRLVIIGAVHIAATLTRLAREMGFRVVVSDARGRFATPDRFPDVDELILGWPSEVLPRLELDEFSYVVVITHDAKLDNPALQEALASPAPYVGALGSSRTHARRVKALREAGVSQEAIDRVHAPIGLDIGARTPAEIALATMAEIVAVRNRMDEESR